MRDRILAAERFERHYTSTKPMSTGDVARALELTPDGVRWLANERLLPCERTPGGQRVFREGHVQELAHERTTARGRRVTALRPRKAGAPGEPRQLALFGKARLRLVEPAGRSPEVLQDPVVHRARSRRKS